MAHIPLTNTVLNNSAQIATNSLSEIGCVCLHGYNTGMCTLLYKFTDHLWLDIK